jgi:two-component system sensor histidine kinase DesK
VSERLSMPLGTAQRARWVLIGLHVPMAAFLVLATAQGFGVWRPRDPFIVVPLVLAISALQVRHSLASARGQRPAYWQWSFAAVLLLAYLPLLWLTWQWEMAQWFVAASGVMLLPRPAKYAAVALPALGLALAEAWRSVADLGLSLPYAAWIVFYVTTVVALGAVSLYGAALLVRAVDELHAARAELAQLEVGRERLRISRDLHDLLGQSLSAVSLKGDLAARLLPNDPTAARQEIEGLSEVARGALRDVRAVAHDTQRVDFEEETDGAVRLLRAAGVDTTVRVDAGTLAPAVDALLGWSVREGVTNVLRHSDADTCSITVTRDATAVRLEIVNDRAVTPTGVGSGLAGLAERAESLDGFASTTCTRDGSFLLRVEVPAEVT